MLAQVFRELRGILVQRGPSIWGIVVCPAPLLHFAEIGLQIDYILGYGGPDTLLKARRFLRAQEKSIVHADMELDLEKDSPVTPTQKDFTKSPKPLPTSPGLLAGRKEPS